MHPWLTLLIVILLLAANACVSVGTKAITDPDVVSRIEVGKSTQAEVAALLGYPLTASYGEAGEETWHFFYTTMAPQPTEIIPVIKALNPDLRETTRILAVTFNQDGAVKSLQLEDPVKGPAASG